MEVIIEWPCKAVAQSFVSVTRDNSTTCLHMSTRCCRSSRCLPLVKLLACLWWSTLMLVTSLATAQLTIAEEECLYGLLSGGS